ncbi:MAG: TIGR03936 family radical SAM-associated protein [Thermoguttaceae bacterium]
MVRQRVRIRFSKSGPLKYIGHKDLLRALEALLRRVRVPVAMSGGFHPKMRMSFPSALALGIEGCEEVFDLELEELVHACQLKEKMNQYSIPGLDILDIRSLQDEESKARIAYSVFEINVPESFRQEIVPLVDILMNETHRWVEKANGKQVDLRAALHELHFAEDSGCLTASFRPQEGPEAGFRELLVALHLDKEMFKTIFPRRVQCQLVE